MERGYKKNTEGESMYCACLETLFVLFFSEYYEWEGRRVERYIFGFTSRKISLRELPKKAHAIQMLHFIANIEDQIKWNFVSKSLHNLKVTEIWPLTRKSRVVCFFQNCFIVENSAFLTSVNDRLHDHMQKTHKKGSGKVTQTFAYFVEPLMITKYTFLKLLCKICYKS